MDTEMYHIIYIQNIIIWCLFFHRYSKELNNIIGLCLQTKQNSRPSAQESLNNHFIISVINNNIIPKVLENLDVTCKKKLTNSNIDILTTLVADQM